MKDLINVFVKDCRKEGFTLENYIIGGAFVTAIVAVCVIAEIINAL